MPVVRRWLLEVDGHYGFLFGNGVIARFLELYYEGTNEPTPAKAVWVLVRGILSALVNGPYVQRLLAPYAGTVEVDGRVWPGDRWMMIGAGTADDIGIGFRPFWKALRHPGRMHVVGTSSLRPMTLVRELPRIRLARQVEGDGFVDDVAQQVVLRADAPIGYMIDGDFYRGGQVLTVRIGPQVDFVVPE
jgi:diacylglycerol kinase family enzyme